MDLNEQSINSAIRDIRKVDAAIKENGVNKETAFHFAQVLAYPLAVLIEIERRMALKREGERHQEPQVPVKRKRPEDVREALELCESILSMCDEVPEGGEEFVCSIREKVESIQEFVDEKNRVSPAQLNALKNMESGVGRWLE